MLAIWNGHGVVVLLAFIQSLVFTISDGAERRPKVSDQLIADCVGVPWMQGISWVAQSPESSRAKEVRALIRGIESGEKWALKMLDDLLKIEREISESNIEKIETEDQCIQSNVRNDNIGYQNSRDNSCAIHSLEEIFVINGGTNSFPSSTFKGSLKNKTKVLQSFNDHAQKKPLIRKFDLEVNRSKVNSEEFTTAEIAVILVFLTNVAFIISCTICDILRRRRSEGKVSSATVITLSKFSLYTNARTILRTEVTPQMMPAIHGIRFLSSLLIVCGHRYLTSTVVFGHKLTILTILEGKNSSLSFLSLMGTYIVDTFLLISGFIVAHMFFTMIPSENKVSWPMICLFRYFRMMPCLAALMLFGMFLFHRTGSGPLWEFLITQTVDHCQESWWTYLLYVQNLMKNGTMCFPHGWYLALEMQLFGLSALILYPLHYWPKFGLRVLGSLLVVSVATPAIILANNSYSNANLRLDVEPTRLLENFENYYIPTYNRAFPYVVGIFLGYEIALKKRRLTQVAVRIGWLLTSALTLFCIWLTNRIYNSNFAYHLPLEIASTTLVRPFWSIAMAWIIFACTQGYGGLATRFLSLPFFFPLSRLSYCIFLVHAVIQTISLTSLQAPPKYLSFEMAYGICGDLVLSISTAFVFSLFIEAPVVALINILRRHDSSPQQATVLKQPLQNGNMALESCKIESNTS